MIFMWFCIYDLISIGYCVRVLWIIRAVVLRFLISKYGLRVSRLLRLCHSLTRDLLTIILRPTYRVPLRDNRSYVYFLYLCSANSSSILFFSSSSILFFFFSSIYISKYCFNSIRFRSCKLSYSGSSFPCWKWPLIL